MRIVTFITQASVIDQILARLRPAPRARHTPGRGAPHRRGPHEPGRVAFDTSVRRRPDRPLSTAPTRPATTAGTVGVGGRPTVSPA
jgi:hypothetical protein